MISPTEPHTTVKAETIRRTPDNFYWAMWDKLDIDPIELDEFLRHWHLSRGELSRLCHCSLHTVNCWFASGEYHRAPTKEWAKEEFLTVPQLARVIVRRALAARKQNEPTASGTAGGKGRGKKGGEDD